ncbi:MAG: hypothetical protein K0R20_1835 [Actinomycetia bacterium]|nr:hypothetical protein [Actinomycetes bacterium]
MIDPRDGTEDAAGGATPDEPALAAPEGADEAVATLAREVYWAGEGGSGLPADARSLRERLDAFTYQMRADQRQAVPVGESFLGSNAGWKRGLKQFVWRLTRFSTMRYDRLLAELAEMNGELARRLVATEEELSRLRRLLDDSDGDQR